MAVDGLEISPFEAGGSVVDLDRELVGTIVQTGERLTVELTTPAALADECGSERVRFRDTLEGEPTRWLGHHTPDREQLWRLWYRIQLAREVATTR